MKRLIITFTLLSSLLVPALVSTAPAAANIFQHCGNDSAGGTPAVCQSVSSQNGSSNPVVNIIKSAIEVIAYLTGALAIIFIVIAGIRFVTSGGSPDGVAQARNALIYALVGVGVSALAGSLVAFVIDNVH